MTAEHINIGDVEHFKERIEKAQQKIAEIAGSLAGGSCVITPGYQLGDKVYWLGGKWIVGKAGELNAVVANGEFKTVAPVDQLEPRGKAKKRFDKERVNRRLTSA